MVQTFLAGDPTSANPYSNEFIEVRFRELSPTQSEMTFINGWDGEALTEEGIDAAKAAWSQWLDGMEKLAVAST